MNFVKLTLITLIYSGIAAQAATPFQVCDREADAFKNSCLQVIQQNRFYSNSALDICNGETDSEVTIQCLNTVANNNFSEIAIPTCARENDAYKNACLAAIANKPNFQIPATGVCNNMADSALTVQCLTIVAGNSFQPDALSACAREVEAYQVGCLSAIANRRFDPRAVELCNSETDSGETIQCFIDAASR